MASSGLADIDAPIKVLVVDDHRSVADALAGALDARADFVSLGTAASAEAALRATEEHDPDVVLMDAYLSNGSGITATERILEIRPSTTVVILTGHPTPQLLVRAAQAGAAGFLTKEAGFADVAEALRSAHAGSMLVPTEILEDLLATARTPQQRDHAPPVGQLTNREREVLALLAEGTDLRSIAEVLDITVETCRGHVKNLMMKLGAHSQLQAVLVAAQVGLLAPDHPITSPRSGDPGTPNRP